MILTISLYLLLSLFFATLWFLIRYKNKQGDEETQNSIVLLLGVEVIPLVVLMGILISSDIKNDAWLAPITSYWVLIAWAATISFCIMYLLLGKKYMIKNFFKDHGLKLFIYSLIVAILLFFLFLIIIGIAYSVIEDYKVKGFANFVGITGIITTLLGILVTLLQFIKEN